MENKEVHNFSHPTRQSLVAILLFLLRSIVQMLRNLWPLALVVLLGNGQSKGDKLVFVAIGISILSAIYSIINYYKTYFYIENNELIFHTGILQKKKVVIPIRKVQNVNFEQSLIHRILDVVKVNIETAGSDKSEIELKALNHSTALQLRSVLLEKTASQLDFTAQEVATAAQPMAKQEVILQLQVADLIKVGITENHLRSFGLILAFVLWIYDNVKNAGITTDDYEDSILDTFSNSFFLWASLLFFMTIISVIISLFSSVIRHYGLSFYRSEKGFKIVEGLFTVKEVAALDNKIQYIYWSENILQRLLGIKKLFINQTTSPNTPTKKRIAIAGCNISHIDRVVQALYPNISGALPALQLESTQGLTSNKRYFTRLLTLLSPLFVAAISWAIYAEQTFITVACSLLYLLILTIRYLNYKRMRCLVSGEMIFVKHGNFTHKYSVLPIKNIQQVTFDTSPYQRKHGLCSMILHTSAGAITLPYIPQKEAQHLNDFVLFLIEK